MARGVSSNFLAIARREQRLGQRAALAALALAPLAAFLAELADEPGYGPVWTLFVLALLAGLAGGYVLGKRRLDRYEGELKLRWDHWMRHAANAARLDEVERRVNEQDPLPAGLWSGLVALLVGLNLALFALLWIAHPVADPLAWAVLAIDGLVLGGLVTTSALLWVAHPAANVLAWGVLAIDGLVLGGLVTTSALLLRWARDFVASAEDLVRRGELGLWGER